MNEPEVQCLWHVAEEDRARTAEWANALGIPHLIAHLIQRRGIESVEEARGFLDPSLEHISDPFLLEGMREAVDRIGQARDRGEHVLVFGDYDVDGISGTALLFNALRRFGIERCSYGLPSRLLEGYGLSPDRVEAAQHDGVTLIVTVDNGINAREAADMARQLGIDLIVTDHHQLEGEMPYALAVIDPARDNPPGPNRYASGVTVAFKLAWALTGEQRDIDLCALGTVADIVPLRGENRDLVAVGLDQMRRAPRIGLEALAEAARISIAEVTSESIAFQLAPRINAVGRLKDGELALQLLLSESPEEAHRIAHELDEANEERRAIEHAILEDALAELDETFHPDHRAIVLARRNWHPGVIGITASQLQSRYNRPVILIAVDDDGVGRGSGRSLPEFDLVGALNLCAGHLVRYGGHPAAAGMTILEENVQAFAESFDAEARRRLPDGVSVKMLDVDGMVSLSEIEPRLLRSMEQLAPFGLSNPQPVFCSYAVQPVANSVRELRGGHLKFAVRQGSQIMDVIGFRMAGRLTATRAVDPIDIAFTPQFNTWRGETTIPLVLKDIHI
ncbi:MAG: single-stranded-DNA-specific exonuclease [Candidatus Hydrogenedentes bacterium]|nr:single-stranded-DNA-specific exonuclease [Candidatus Hydrogenedentota bacterium]